MLLAELADVVLKKLGLAIEALDLLGLRGDDLAKDCRIIASGQTMDELLSQLGDVDLQSVLVHRVEQPGKVIYS